MENLAVAFISGIISVILTLLIINKIKQKDHQIYNEKIKALEDRLNISAKEIYELKTQNQNEIIELKRIHNDELHLEIKAAMAKGYEQAKLEYDYKSKVFGLSMRPYVKITDAKGFFNNEKVSLLGYQFQLLVNGIPAFQPHVIIEKEEQHKEINKENISFLIEEAVKITTAAAKLYLGDASGAVSYIQEVLVDK